MSGICGWIDIDIGNDDPLRILRSMANGLVNVSYDEYASASIHGASLCITSAGKYCHFFQEDNFLVALNGAPTWASRDLAELAQQSGHAVALLEAYKQHGLSLFQYLHGSFSLVLIDRVASKAIIAIDRMGIQQMSYAHNSGRGVVFGSTADSVRHHPNVSAHLDIQNIFSYVFFHAVPSPGTIYREQNKLLPGQYLVYEAGQLIENFYWQPQFLEDQRTPVEQLGKQLREYLTSSINRCADNREAGAFLSGGVDSSVVSGLLSTLRESPVNTYSIGFAEKGYDEMEYARIAAAHFQTQAHEYYVTPEDVATIIPKIAQAYDEPFGNASAVPTYYCARMAKQDGVEVLLAGDGGDELFGGNARYAEQKIFEAYHRIPTFLRKYVVEPLVFGFPGGSKITPVRKACSYVRQANIPLPDRLESYNFLNLTPLREVFHPDFLAAVDPTHPHQLLRREYASTENDSPVNRMLRLEWKQVLADNDLRKVTRMCALANMQVCFPMLQDDVVQFSTKIPSQLKVKGLKLRFFFKHAYQDFLPTEVLTKSKHGFGLPFGVWLRTAPQLQEIARDSLESFKQRGYVRPEFIDHLLHQHQTVHSAFYGEMIWVLMMLELWFQAHGF